MKRFLFASVAALMVATGANAQQTATMPGMDKKPMDMPMLAPAPNDSASTKGYKNAMMKMMAGMPQFKGDADIDFMTQMRVHHQAAIDMARVVLTTGKDAEVKKLAQDIINAQEKEIATIDAWLKVKGGLAATRVNGEVVKIDTAAGKVTLKHGPIKNLDMDSMTMVFRVADPAMLGKVKAGDKVEFEADRINGAITITTMDKAK